MRGRTIRTAEKGERLLEKLRCGYSIMAACKAEGIGRSTFYEWRDDDPEFAKRVEDAIEDGTDMFEDVARLRAIKGSDMLLMQQLNARRPEKYKQRSAHEMTGQNGAPLTVVIGDRSDGPA